MECCGLLWHYNIYGNVQKKSPQCHAWVCSTHVLAWMQAMLWGLGACCPRKFFRSQMQSQTRQWLFWEFVEFCYRHYTDRWFMVTRALRAHTCTLRAPCTAHIGMIRICSILQFGHMLSTTFTYIYEVSLVVLMSRNLHMHSGHGRWVWLWRPTKIHYLWRL